MSLCLQALGIVETFSIASLIETAAATAAASAGAKGLLVQKVVIPQPRPS